MEHIQRAGTPSRWLDTKPRIPTKSCWLRFATCRIERALDFGRKYGFLAAYRNVDEMLRQENLDGCIAVVPPENISELGIKLLTMGIPCVVEKPLGASLAEAQALRDSAAATKTPNMVSVNRRFMPSLNRAIEWAQHMPARFATYTALSPGTRARNRSSSGPQRSTR